MLDALSAWHAQYTLDNPGYTGNLYVAQSNSQGIGGEQWLSTLAVLRNTNSTSRTSAFPGNSAASGGNSGWLESGTNASYSWTIDGVPTDWSNSSYVLPTRVFIISFCNEASGAYHTTARDWTSEPTSTWATDYNAFVTEFNTMDYFGGILYPVTSQGGGVHNHAYAAITGQDPVLETGTGNFADSLGLNYNNAADWTSVFSSGTATNPYTLVNLDLAGYNWAGVYDKQEVGGILDFDGPEFASDINTILDPSGETGSAINVFESYVDEILTLRGLYSEDITFTLNDDGCIVMEINDDIANAGTSGTNGSSGTDGTSGTDGSGGSSGTDGSGGSSGTDGSGGSSGTDGTNGSSGQKGQKGQKGAPGTSGSQGSGGSSGTSGLQGASGYGYCYEHIAINPVAKDTNITSSNLQRAFVICPTYFNTEGYHLTEIASSYGNVVNAATVNYELRQINPSTGQDTLLRGWTHAGGDQFETFSVPTPPSQVPGAHLYIKAEGDTAIWDGYGFTVTLTWTNTNCLGE